MSNVHPPANWLMRIAALVICAWLLTVYLNAAHFIRLNWLWLLSPAWVPVGLIVLIAVGLWIAEAVFAVAGWVQRSVARRRQRRDLEDFRRAWERGLIALLVREHRSGRGEHRPDVRNSKQ